MKITPLTTLPLRASLKLERAQNRRDIVRSVHSERRDLGWSPPAGLQGLRVRVDPYPDLGHQMSTLVSGYLWARDLGVPYFGGDVTKDPRGLFALTELSERAPSNAVEHRVAATGFETESWALPGLRASLDRVAHRQSGPWVGRLALDQRRWDQTPASEALRRAVICGYLGERLLEEEARSGYIAIHARRGDIGPHTHADRWLGIDYYERLIGEIRTVPSLRDFPVRLFTSGDAGDLHGLQSIGVDVSETGDRDHDFIALAAARLIVTAPSSFGFFAALVSTAPVIARVPWWHHVPDGGRWFSYQSEGGLDRSRLARVMSGTTP